MNPSIKGYYRVHASIYDATRWAFLFGRREIFKWLKIKHLNSKTLLEAGCGTGHNLHFLAENFPNMKLLGVDVSPDMLARARKQLSKHPNRVFLFENAYLPGGFEPPAPPDIVLFSYALTMFNPGWEAAIEKAHSDLRPGGQIAVVDFHRSRFGFFRWWMSKNHVCMEGHLLPVLREKFEQSHFFERQGLFGLWTYFLFVGLKT